MRCSAPHKTARWALGVLCVALAVLLARSPGIEFYLNSVDHGYQLGLGRQVVLGLFPGVDLFMNYGPLVAFTSAAGIWLSGSLLGETLLCATGYAASLALIGALAARYVSPLAGLVGPALALLLIARFYKWYYWLFPLFALAGTLSVLDTTQPRRRVRRMFATGVLCGMGALYRLDFAVMLPSGVVSGFLLARERCGVRSAWRAPVIAYLAGFVLPVGTWCAVLALRAGTPRAILDWVCYFVVSSQAKLIEYSLPLPRPGVSALGGETGEFLLYVLAVTTYMAGLALGWRDLRPADRHCRQRARLLVVGSVIGLSIFAQACHRADLWHLLQVIPPALLVGPALVSALWHRPTTDPADWRVTGRRAMVSVYLLLAALAIGAVWPALGGDLSRDQSDLVARYRGLRLLQDALPAHPYLFLAKEVHAMTRPGERVLVLPNVCSLYFFIERPLSGFRIHFLYRESDAWAAREQAAVELHPPAVVLADRTFVAAEAAAQFDRSQPEVAAYVRSHYPRVTDAGAGWVILTRADGGDAGH
jgi:hypothetical protein